MSRSLTIVLPIHNGESNLENDVEQLLEIAGELTAQFTVLIVDDGSTDDTFEVASELSEKFPQVAIVRHPLQRGLGPAIETVRKQVKSDVVIVHDGTSNIDTNQIRELWRTADDTKRRTTDESTMNPRTALHELSGVTALHQSMETVHRRMIGFQLISAQEPNDDSMDDVSESSATKVHQRTTHKSAGSIPPLPRPKIYEAVADFATGE